MRGASVVGGKIPISMVSDISHKTTVLNVFINQNDSGAEHLHKFFIIDEIPVVTPI